MKDDILKAQILNVVQLMLCVISIITTGIVQVVFRALWLIAVVVLVVYMVKGIKELKEEEKKLKELEAKINMTKSLIKHNLIVPNGLILEILEREENEPR